MPESPKYGDIGKREKHGSSQKKGGLGMVKLTKAEALWVDWALTGPISEWDRPLTLCYDKDCLFEEAQMAIRDRNGTTLEGTKLTFSWGINPTGIFIDCLLNMLEDVAPNLEDGAGFEDALSKYKDYGIAKRLSGRRKSAALKAAAKIREALNQDTTEGSGLKGR